VLHDTDDSCCPAARVLAAHVLMGGCLLLCMQEEIARLKAELQARQLAATGSEASGPAQVCAPGPVQRVYLPT
jgi:hypothetical protein